jgi:hypothetical protein
MSVFFLSFMIVVSLMQCYAAAEKQMRFGENTKVMECDGPSSKLLSIQQYSGYLGGSGNDELTSFVFIEPNIVYLAGTTTSTDFPEVNSYQSANAGGKDCFVMKMNIATETVIYSTYIGGTEDDTLSDIVVDNEGNLFATGQTTSEDFPVLNAYDSDYNDTEDIRDFEDTFVLKLNPTGDGLIYSTYFGGTGPEHAKSIDIDSEGNAYVFGDLIAFPITLVNPLDGEIGVQHECFLLKFNSTGSGLDFSSYYGGSEDEYAASISIDDDDNVYLIGYTDSEDLPGLSGYDTSINGLSDCFVAKINSTLTGLDYVSYIGGTGIDEVGRGFVDSSGVVYVTGNTASTNFPTIDAYDDELSGLIDCFVFALSSDGNSLEYSTYLGGSGIDYGAGISIFTNEAIYITGKTHSNDFPTTSGADSSLSGEIDGFASKLNLSTNVLDYSTYIGGSGDDYGEGIAVDADQNIIVAGYTDSEDFPTDATHNGLNDWFLYVIQELPSSPITIIDGPTLLLVAVAGVVIVAAVVCVRRDRKE